MTAGIIGGPFGCKRDIKPMNQSIDPIRVINRSPLNQSTQSFIRPIKSSINRSINQSMTSSAPSRLPRSLQREAGCARLPERDELPRSRERVLPRLRAARPPRRSGNPYRVAGGDETSALNFGSRVFAVNPCAILEIDGYCSNQVDNYCSNHIDIYCSN